MGGTISNRPSPAEAASIAITLQEIAQSDSIFRVGARRGCVCVTRYTVSTGQGPVCRLTTEIGRRCLERYGSGDVLGRGLLRIGN